MMKHVVYNTESTLRDVAPLASGAMFVMLVSSFVLMIYFVIAHSIDELTSTTAGFTIQTLFSLSAFIFIAVGVYWRKIWTARLDARANNMSRRHDYFEINVEDLKDLILHEWSGEIIDFRGLNRSFVHFNNEQDRIIFRLQR